MGRLKVMRFGGNWVKSIAPLLVKLFYWDSPLIGGHSLTLWVPGKARRSTGRQLRSSFFEPPRDIYSEQLLPEAQASGV